MFLDELKEWVFENMTPYWESVLTTVNQAHVIDVQNVAEFLLGSGKQLWTYSDFPNIAPPFPLMWFEWQIKAGDEGRPYKTKGIHRVGILMESIDLHHEDTASRRKAIEHFEFSPLEAELLTNPELSGHYRWVMRGTVFKHIIPGMMKMGEMWILVREDGQITLPQKQIKYVVEKKMIALMAELGEDEKGCCDFLKSAHFPIWLALTFMHCQNVRTERLAPIPEALQRSREKKGKPRLTRAHVILIDPMKKVLRAATGSSYYERGAQTLHIVRGHFRTYTDNPLFGKYKGTFWVPMHTAGEKGLAPKNRYNIKTPNEQA